MFTLVAAGKPVLAEVRLGYPHGEQCVQAATGSVPTFATLRYATFHLPTTPAQELKVWAHTVTPTGGSESLSAWLEVHDGAETRQFDLTLSGGQVTVPLTGSASWVKIIRSEASLA